MSSVITSSRMASRANARSPLIKGTRVQRIGRVPQNGREGVLLHQAAQGFRVLGVRLLGLAAPRVSRKNWNVSALMESASSPMWRYPLELDK